MDVLGEDLLLLSIDPRSGKIVTGRLGYGLAGSELVRLAAAGRISIDRDRIIVTSARPTGDTELDAALASMTRSRRPPTAKHWITQRRTGIHEAYLARLSRARAVAPGKSSFLGQRRWQITDPDRVTRARRWLDTIASGDGHVDLTDAAFGGLAHAIGLDNHLYPGFGGHSQRKRLAQVARGQWTAAAVKGAVNAAGLSAMAATDAATQAAMNAATNAAMQAAMAAAVQASVTAAMPPAGGTGAEAPHHH
jgi:hypothetical protein